MSFTKSAAKWIAAMTLVGFSVSAVVSQSAPFGNAQDVEYADKLWAAIEALKLAGPDAIKSLPYEGSEPHGFVLETFFANAIVDGYKGTLVLKRNYGPAGVEVETVQADPSAYLAAITVMFKREAGYDPQNNDWFWAKYLPDGSLDRNAKDMALAGRVAKGAPQGCIACHSAAPGDDYVYTSDAVR